MKDYKRRGRREKGEKRHDSVVFIVPVKAEDLLFISKPFINKGRASRF